MRMSRKINSKKLLLYKKGTFIQKMFCFKRYAMGYEYLYCIWIFSFQYFGFYSFMIVDFEKNGYKIC